MKKLLLYCFVLLIPFISYGQDTLYVSVDGTGTGTSWDDPTDLPSAIDKVNSNEISVHLWLAEGTYNPKLLKLSVYADFELIGGFNGEKHVEARKAGSNSTFDGEGQIEQFLSINSTHTNITIDGITFTNVNSTVANSGAIAFIDDNQNSNKGEVTINNCLFSSNVSAGDGAAINANTFAKVKVTNSHFHNNTASGNGGAIWTNSNKLELRNSSFTGNTAIQGGAVFATLNYLFVGCEFRGNSADEGGAFKSLVTDYVEQGDMVIMPSINSHIINTLVSGNKSELTGALDLNCENSQGANINLVNLTVTGNFNNNIGGVISIVNPIDLSTSLSVENCFIWNNLNTGKSIALWGNSPDFTTVNNSLLDGAYDGTGGWNKAYSTIDEGTNFNQNGITSVFVDGIDATSAPASSGDFSLPLNSPFIDKGALVQYESLKYSLSLPYRLYGASIDIGASEYVIAPGAAGSFWGKGEVIVPMTPKTIDDVFTFESWYIFEQSNELLTTSNGIRLYTETLQNGTMLKLDYGSNSVEVAQVDYETWYHLALTFDGLHASVYLNGEKKMEIPLAGFIANAIYPFYISAYYADETRVYNTARDSDALLKDMHQVVDPETESLIHYFNYDQSSDKALYDHALKRDVNVDQDGMGFYNQFWINDSDEVFNTALLTPFFREATDVTHNSYTLNWDEVPGATYTLTLHNNPVNPDFPISETLKAGETSYTFSGASPNQVFSWELTATFGGRTSQVTTYSVRTNQLFPIMEVGDVIDFGAIEQGMLDIPAKEFSITNAGPVDLNIEFGWFNDGMFSFANAQKTDLISAAEPDNVKTYSVTMNNADDIGTYEEWITIYSDALMPSLEDGLFQYFPFDVGVKAIVGQNEGVYESGSISVTGLKNNAFAIDEATWFSFSEPLVTGKDFAVNMWVNTVDEDFSLISCSGDAGYDKLNIIYNSGSINVHTKYSIDMPNESAQLVKDFMLNDGQWHMVTVSAGQGELALYVDGYLAGIVAYNETLTNLNYWQIGGSSYLVGQVDEIRSYNRALTPEEVYSLSGKKKLRITAEVIEPIVLDLGPNVAICEGEEYTFTANVDDAEYLWSNGETTQSITVDAAETYSVTVTKLGIDKTDDVKLVVNTPVVVGEVNDIEICQGESVNLDDVSIENADSYVWSVETNYGQITDGVYEFTDAGNSKITLKLHVKAKEGCADSIYYRSLQVNSLPEFEVVSAKEICINQPEEVQYAFDTMTVGEETEWFVDGVSTGKTLTFDGVVASEVQIKAQTTNLNGCKSADSIYVILLDIPSIEIEDIPNKVYVDETFDVVAITDSPDNEVLWATEWDKSTIRGGIEQSLIPTRLGADTVVATLSNESCSASDSLFIEVVEAPLPIAVESIDIPKMLGLVVDGEIRLEPMFSPVGAIDNNLKWLSANEDVASVDQDGKIVAHKEGTAKIIVLSEKYDIVAYSMLTVSAAPIVAESVEVPQVMTISLGGSKMVSVVTYPLNATTKDIVWTSSDESIATVDENGYITSIAVGEVEITATLANQQSAICKVSVLTNTAPERVFIPAKTILSSELKAFELSAFLKDDITLPENMTLEVISADNVVAEIEGTSLTLKSLSEEFVGNDTLQLKVTDEEGLSVIIPFKVTVTDSDEKPEIILDEVFLKEGSLSKTVDLSLFVNDDFTADEDIVWSVEDIVDFAVLIENNKATISVNDETWTGTEEVVIKATDSNGNSAEKTVVFSNEPKENTAPVIDEIPDNRTSDMVFLPINLNDFVKDDYTAVEDIVWMHKASSNINIMIINNACFAQIYDDNWYGTEMIEFTAIDAEGLSATAEISFTHEYPAQGIWTGMPNINFTANRTITVPAGEVQFFADVVGASAVKWEIEGAELNSPSISNPVAKFNEPGVYDVSLIAQNATGLDTLTKLGFITVYGITHSDTLICKGDIIEVETFAENADAYLWSNGDETATATITGDKSMAYYVTVTSGIVELVDSIYVEIPPVAELGESKSICTGDAMLLSPGTFETYKWTETIESDLSIVTATEAGKYKVEVVDALGCTSTDSVEILSLLELPDASVVFEDSVCFGLTTVITAQPGLAYQWSTGSTANAIEVGKGGVYSLTVTDQQFCESINEFTVSILEPYKEQIGIATISDDGESALIAWEVTPDQRTVYYELYRESGNGTYDSLTTIHVGDSTYFQDLTSNVKSQSYKYKLRTYDECGNSVDSDHHTTMHLSKHKELDGGVTLTWNNYEGLYVHVYDVMRRRDGVWTKITEIVPADEGLSRFTDLEYEKGDNYRISFIMEESVIVSQLKTNTGPYSHSISNIAEIDIVSVENTDLKLKLYPMPVVDELVIEPNFTENYSYTIWSADGKIIAQGKSENNTTVDLSDVADGLYSIEIMTGNGTATKTFVKQ